MVNLRQSFEDRKNECLDACRDWCKTTHNPFDFLQYKIENPTEAWFNYKASWDMYQLSEDLKAWFYKYVKGDLWDNPKFRIIYDWLCSFTDYPSGERCGVSPRCLREVGFTKTDELWYWKTPDHTWQHMFGSAGYCIVRNSVIIWSIMTEMN